MENGLRGPFDLLDDVIDREVVPTRAGAYVLEDSRDLINFHVMYAGRSETDLNNQLHVHVGTYKRFRYEYCESARSAFEKQCALYHAFEPWDNPVHPQRLAGTAWNCPQCNLVF